MDSAVDLSVIVPCYNEEDNLKNFVNRTLDIFKTIGLKSEIILINDGSTDGTQQVIEKIETEFGNVLTKRHQFNRGIVESWASGLRISKGRYLVTIDADLQYSPEDITRLYHTIIKTNADLVQGWRVFELKRFRYILSRLLAILLNFFFFANLKDPKSGFVIYKREALQSLLQYKSNYVSYQSLIAVTAISRGYNIKQIPVEFYMRRSGTSSLKLTPTLIKIIKFFRDIWRWHIEFNHQ